MKISIITVTFNCAKTIERTIQSVLSQDYSNLEYIIIDGASTDGTVEILKKYDNKLAYWESAPDAGIYDAMNKALGHVTGDVVNFQGGDDFLYDASVCTKVVEAFEEEDCDLLFGISDYSGKRIARYDCDGLDDLLLRSVPHQALFAKRSVFTTIGRFNSRYRVVADYDWLLRAIIAKVKIRTIEQMISVYSLDGISSGITNAKELLYVRTQTAKVQKRYHLLPQIFTSFHSMMREHILRITVNNAAKEAKEWLQQLIGYSMTVSIWGIGVQGKACIEALQKLGVNVERIIDTAPEKQGGCYEGIPICGYHENCVYNHIVITPLKSGEIVSALRARGLHKNKEYSLWNDIRCEITNIGMQIPMDGKMWAEVLDEEYEALSNAARLGFSD